MASGMKRPVDKMGRVVIPKEIREQLDVKSDRDCFEITLEGDTLLLKKFEQACVFCGDGQNTIEFGGKLVCRQCLEKLAGQAQMLAESEKI